jgi:TM2 domain-containing membrane protein YozV
MQIQPSTPPKNPIIAAILSLIIGGGGQLYIGQTKKGIILTVATIVLYFCFGIGAILAILGAVDAYMLTDKLQKGEAIGDMQFFWEN